MDLQGTETFLLGAGFSNAVHDAMPLTNDLGALVAEQLRLAGHNPSLLEDLFGGDFEAWLTHLSDGRPWLAPADVLRDRALFLEASRVIAALLTEAQLRTEYPPDWLRRLVTYWHQHQSVVLTLNYDNLVEEAIQELRFDSGGGPMHFSSTYGVPITNVRLRRAGTFGSGEAATLRFLKLHGSINWYYSGSDAPHGETIYYGDLPRGWEANGVPVVANRDTDLLVDRVPYIVPPTGFKSTFFNNETLRAQWAVGHKLCLEAGNMVVLGYSLPPSDLMMRTFLHEVTDGRSIALVNRDGAVGERFGRLLPGTRVDGETFVGDGQIQAFAERLPVTPTD